jgi:integrase
MMSGDVEKAFADADATVVVARNKAVVLFGLASACRRSELSALDFEDLKWQEAGIVAMIRHSKTDQLSEGREVAIPKRLNADLCPVRALEAWIACLKAHGLEAKGPIFRPIVGHKPTAKRLSDGAILYLTKKVAVLAGLDPKNIGAHSLRSGYVTEARIAGLDWGSIMEQTRHSKVETAKKYYRGGADPFKLTNVQKVFEAFDSKRQSSRPKEKKK